MIYRRRRRPIRSPQVRRRLRRLTVYTDFFE
jgi:hypothetical protein